MENISIVTRLKNREALLNIVLPSWLRFSFERIWIVDWKTNGNLQEIIDKHQDGRIYRVLVETAEKDSFMWSEAWNVGDSLVTTKYVANVDCDIFITKGFDTFDFKDDCYYRGGFLYENDEGVKKIGHADVCGTCVVTKEMIDKANGYSEFMKHYGGEDHDFFRRLKKLGFKERHITYLRPLKHGEGLRLRYNGGVSLEESMRDNKSRPKWNAKCPRKSHKVKIIHPDKTIVERVI